MLQELVLWSTIGTLLYVAGYPIDSWQYWCFLGTYWAVSQLSKQRGKIEGIIGYIGMSEQEQARLKQLLKDANK